MWNCNLSPHNFPYKYTCQSRHMYYLRNLWQNTCNLKENLIRYVKFLFSKFYYYFKKNSWNWKLTVAFVFDIVMSWFTLIAFVTSVIGLTDTFSVFIAWFIHHSIYITFAISTGGEIEKAILTFCQKNLIIISILSKTI